MNYNSDYEQKEEEEDSNILSLEDVQDIIKYYDFFIVGRYDNYLFYDNDCKKFMKDKKSTLINDFFDE